MKNPTKTLLIFDYDGVIVDSLDVVVKILQELQKKYNLPQINHKNDVRKLFKINFFESIQKVGISKEKGQALLSEIKDLSLVLHKEFHPFPGIVSLLKTVAHQCTMAIISSNHSETIRSELNNFGLNGIFPQILGGETKTKKVKKINDLAKYYLSPKENIFFITDTTGDIQEGKQAGIKTVGVSWGYHSKAWLQKANPDYIFEKVEDLEQFLKSIL